MGQGQIKQKDESRHLPKRLAAFDPALAHEIFALAEQIMKLACKGRYHPLQIDAVTTPYRPENLCTLSFDTNRLFILQEKGQLIGFAHAHENQIEFLGIHPQFQKQGLGQILLRAVESEMEKTKPAILYATINAWPFYQHHGYSIEHEGSQLFGDDVPVKCFYMVKDLSGDGKSFRPYYKWRHNISASPDLILD